MYVCVCNLIKIRGEGEGSERIEAEWLIEHKRMKEKMSEMELTREKKGEWLVAHINHTLIYVILSLSLCLGKEKGEIFTCIFDFFLR